jgi:hypothetical protein
MDELSALQVPAPMLKHQLSELRTLMREYPILMRLHISNAMVQERRLVIQPRLKVLALFLRILDPSTSHLLSAR